MGEGQKVAAYFDLDGTLLNASSEKTLTGVLARRRPWRIPYATIAWTLGATFGLLTGKAPYDALRNRGHLSLASWQILEQYSEEIATTYLKERVSSGAWERLDWHRKQGHRLVLVTATVAPMAEAMARVLGMDEVYGCGPKTEQECSQDLNVVGLSLGEKERFRLWSKMLRNTGMIFHNVTGMETRMPIHGS